MELGRFSYYVVRKGFIPGVYDKWEDCRKQVEGFSGNEYKGFNVLAEAEQWMRGGEPLKRDDRMQQNAEEAVSFEIDSLRQRIKRLEEEKEDLMNQVEMFNEVLDDS
ncbi:hypothetical protein AHAS_Ahas03G0223300 [Arachis hypogaea]